MKAGFAKIDITPRVGFELSGFGPYLGRRSTFIRDNLWARGMALQSQDTSTVLVSCDIIGITPRTLELARKYFAEQTGWAPQSLMIHCIHTHSGPPADFLNGWGVADVPYIEILPFKIAQAAINAIQNLTEATVAHAEVPCEGIGLNREYDKDAPPLEDVLKESWRPAKPELTDTTCHVIKFHDASTGKTIGFCSYFGCHPVCCCQLTHHIHGDYAGIATNNLEREFDSPVVGLFLQGAQGDVNSCCVHKPEQESLLALDVIAARYARAVRNGLKKAAEFEASIIKFANHKVKFTRKMASVPELKEKLAEFEAQFQRPDASENDSKLRLVVVKAVAYRKIIDMIESGKDLEAPIEIQGIRIGKITLLGAPFEIMQMIKNEVKQDAKSPVPLVMGLTNGSWGYLPDRVCAARGGYAQDFVPFMKSTLPLANGHDELINALLKLDAELN